MLIKKIMKNNHDKKERSYTYLFIRKSFYINLDFSIIYFIYYFYFKAKPFKFLESKTRSKLINFFQPLVRLIRVFQFTYLFYQQKHLYYQDKDSYKTVTSNYYGHCLITLRLGEYKIINFTTKDVTTVFPKGIPTSEIEKNIDKLIESQKCSLAPKIVNWDLNTRYIKESYINLKPSYLELNDINRLVDETFPILEKINLSTNLESVSLRQYSEKLINNINGLIERHLHEPNFKNKNTDSIIGEFVSIIKKKLENYAPNLEILLAFSHGDFWEGNVLKKNKKYYVIDWNTLDVRSCHYDLYFMLFRKAYESMNNESNIIVSNIDKANKSYQMYLNSKLKMDLLNHLDIYRYLFYLEYIYLKLQEYPRKSQLFYLKGDFINYFKFYESNFNVDESNYYELKA